jgi:hypothetical protein
VLQADGYSGFQGLYEGERVIEATRWAHVWRPFYGLHVTGQAQLATKALRRIGLLYAVEVVILDQPPDLRTRVRQDWAGSVLEELHAWFRATLSRIFGRGDLAGGIRYALARWEVRTRYVADGRLEPDNKPVEHLIRPLALDRKNSHDRLSSATHVQSRGAAIAAPSGMLVFRGQGIGGATVAQTLIRGSLAP